MSDDFKKNDSSGSILNFVSPDEFKKSGQSKPVHQPTPVPGVKDVVAVASGKGGVGKSTVAFHLARALAEQGKRVGIADADIYGPSQALLCRTADVLQYNDDATKALPFEQNGIYSMSIGNLYPPEAHIAWKGPIVSEAVLQIIFEVEWPDLDLLILDMPPGTGDVALTILEQVPLTGAVIVTTPQQVATLDAARGVRMFHNLNVPVFGIVENMAWLTCPCCGEKRYPFGKRGGEALASRMHVRFLGALSLDVQLNEGGLMSQDSVLCYQELADVVAKSAELDRQAREDGIQKRGDPRHGSGDGKPTWEKLIS